MLRRGAGASALHTAVYVCALGSLWGLALAKPCLYTVLEGETAYSIADAQQCQHKAIVDVNANVDFEALQVGQFIVLPESCACPKPPPCSVTVRPGDDAKAMAVVRGCRLTDLVAANPGIDFDDLEGEELVIPVDKCRCAAEVVGCNYIVKDGDTLLGIAADLNCRSTAFQDFMVMNPGLNTDFLRPTQVLVVPANCDCPSAPPMPSAKAPAAAVPAPQQPSQVPQDAAVSGQPADVNADPQEPSAVVRDGHAPAAPGSNSNTWAALAGGAVAAAVILIGAALAVLVMWRRRAVRQRREAKAMKGGPWPGTGSPQPQGPTMDATSANLGADYVMREARTAPVREALVIQSQSAPISSSGAAAQASALAHFAPRAQSNAVEMSWLINEYFERPGPPSSALQDPRDMSASPRLSSNASQPRAPMPAPMVPEPSYLSAIHYMQDVLDTMHATGALLLARWSIFSSDKRRIGGQGIVQFVRDTHTRQEHAVKFFFCERTFQREASLYARPKVREMMAAVVHIESAGVVTTTGAKLPSFIVLKQGSSLDEWALKRQPDFATSLQVLMQVVDRLATLHNAGYVHRDLKPANILWKTEDNNWTIIDFGCVADLSESSTAPLSYSLPYAAPEVAEAIEAGQHSLTVDPALDIWSLGIVVYELLTKQRVFPRGCETSVILAQLTGKQPLPWEPGAPSKARSKVKRLGMLRRSVLSCLSRDPMHRPTAPNLLLALNFLFQQHSKSRTK